MRRRDLLTVAATALVPAQASPPPTKFADMTLSAFGVGGPTFGIDWTYIHPLIFMDGNAAELLSRSVAGDADAQREIARRMARSPKPEAGA